MSRLRVEREYPLEDGWDVVVAGGGPAGSMAAAAAAREGAKTLLIEATSALGGMATMGLVPGWCGFTDGEKFIHRGLAETVRHRLYGGRTAQPLDAPASLGTIDAEQYKRILDDLVTENGATVRFHSQLADVIVADDQTISAVLIADKTGLRAVRAKVYVDCTGDADLAAWAGAEFLKGDETGDMQPVTHCFMLTNVAPHDPANPPAAGWQKKIIDDPKYPLIKDGFFNFGYLRADGTHVLNAGHLWDVDNTDTANLSQALITARKMVKQYHDAFVDYFPERFGGSYLAATAALLGVRETRRIVGDYVLSESDHRARRRFPDEISLNSFFIDIHPSWANRQREFRGEWSWRKEIDDSRYATGEFHGIPYRCLTPKGLKNVIVAGRSVSADRAAHGAIRVMPPCMTMGEAAGVAAAFCAVERVPDFHLVDVGKLRKRLIERGAFLPEPA